MWPDRKSRESESYRQALKAGCAKDGKSKIGGSSEEQRRFFEEVIASHPHCFWMDGCAAPTVRNHVVEFDLKADAKPVARQPIPLSPYDQVRVEYHLEENCIQGKMRKIDTVAEGLPEFSTPVFVVGQDANYLCFGKMI